MSTGGSISGTGSKAKTKSYSFTSRGISAGINYSAGEYFGPSTDANLTQALPTITLGTINVTYAAHAFVVASGPGSVSGGAGPVELVVSGISITDAGVRTPNDSQVIIPDITAMALNDFAETPKKWIGQVTYTLQNAPGSTRTTFNFDFNFGYNKYEDFGNKDFTLTDFECVGVGGANDTNFNIRLLKQDSNNWTYNPAAFVPGGTELLNMSAIHGTENDVANGHPVVFKASGLSIPVSGAGDEGLIVEITTGANNTIQIMDIHIGVEV